MSSITTIISIIAAIVSIAISEHPQKRHGDEPLGAEGGPTITILSSSHNDRHLRTAAYYSTSPPTLNNHASANAISVQGQPPPHKKISHGAPATNSTATICPTSSSITYGISSPASTAGNATVTARTASYPITSHPYS